MYGSLCHWNFYMHISLPLTHTHSTHTHAGMNVYWFLRCRHDNIRHSRNGVPEREKHIVSWDTKTSTRIPRKRCFLFSFERRSSYAQTGRNSVAKLVTGGGELIHECAWLIVKNFRSKKDFLWLTGRSNKPCCQEWLGSSICKHQSWLVIHNGPYSNNTHATFLEDGVSTCVHIRIRF